MTRATGIAVWVFLSCLMGCRSTPQTRAEQDSKVSSVGRESDSAEATRLEIRTGYLTEMPLQHPRISDRDDYLDLYSAAGEWTGQIIVVFSSDSERPEDRSRPVELKGRIQPIDLGGPSGTKNEYKNVILYVESWRQLEPTAVPRK
jgi:hypothetical protein